MKHVMADGKVLKSIEGKVVKNETIDKLRRKLCVK